MMLMTFEKKTHKYKYKKPYNNCDVKREHFTPDIFNLK